MYKRIFVLLSLSAVVLSLTGCVLEDGSPTRINVEAVEKALKEIRAEDPQQWNEAFEKKVNEIYEGDEVISIASRVENGMLKVTGYVEKDGLEGFQTEDEEIFSIEQTEAANEKTTAAVIRSYTTGGNQVEHHTSFAETMFQVWLINKIFSPSYAYHTPRSGLTSLSSFRDSYRKTPVWTEQRRMNSAYQQKRPAILSSNSSRRKVGGVGSGLRKASGFGRKSRIGGRRR